MTRARFVVPILAVLLLASGSAADAQSVQRLPVLDLDGNVIQEDSIAALLRPASGRILRPVAGALAGLLVFTLINDPGRACDIYDPCTPREKWSRGHAPLTGLVVGLMVGFAIPGHSIDRAQAVALIRERRRADKAAQK